MHVRILYTLNAFFSSFSMGQEEASRGGVPLPKPDDFNLTHRVVHEYEVAACDSAVEGVLEEAFRNHQAEFGFRLSNPGRGPDDVGHTSMSVGDVVEIESDGNRRLWMVEGMGFSALGAKGAPEATERGWIVE